MEQKRKNLEVGDNVKYTNVYGLQRFGVVKDIVSPDYIQLTDKIIVKNSQIISIIQGKSALGKLKEAYGQAGITSVARPKEREEPPQDFSELFNHLHKLNVQGAIDHALDVGDVVSLKLLTGGAV